MRSMLYLPIYPAVIQNLISTANIFKNNHCGEQFDYTPHVNRTKACYHEMFKDLVLIRINIYHERAEF